MEKLRKYGGRASQRLRGYYYLTSFIYPLCGSQAEPPEVLPLVLDHRVVMDNKAFIYSLSSEVYPSVK